MPKLTYCITDLVCAAFLKVKGIPFIEIKKKGVFEYEFVFEDKKKECEKLAIEFMNDAPIPCRSFANTIRDLKGAIKR